LIDYQIEMGMDQIQNRIKKSIQAKDSKAVAYLFGSSTRGDFQPDSDWDMLILVDYIQVVN